MPLPDGMADLAVLLIGVTIPDGAAAPTALHHDVTFVGGAVARGGVATVSTDSPVLIAPPLRADLVAVADGTILDTRDGIPDSSPVGSCVIPMTSENALGNHVVLDVRDEHRYFAVYAHLVPGSVRVRLGDRVAA